jgi:PleD family two-component response regulator
MLFLRRRCELETRSPTALPVEIDMPFRPALQARMNELRVFIADDEAPARARLKELLPTSAACADRRGRRSATAWSHRAPAGSGAQVLLLDIQMPGMGGIELARHLAAWKAAGDRFRHRARPPRGRGVRAERARLPDEAGARRRAWRRP